MLLGEVAPIDWLRAIKVPIKKKSVGDSFDEYRVVTLLSVAVKVFKMVVEAIAGQLCLSHTHSRPIDGAMS